MEYNIKLQQGDEEIDITELRELKSEVDRKLVELQNKANFLGFKTFYSLDHASVKLSFKKQ